MPLDAVSYSLAKKAKKSAEEAKALAESHASRHEAGGDDAINGWIAPKYIGPYSDSAARLYFWTRDTTGANIVRHYFLPLDDNEAYLGLSSYRWYFTYTYQLYWWYAAAYGSGYTFFPALASTHHTLIPNSDGYSYVGTDTRRFYLVRAITITSGDLGFEEDRCMVCGKPFKENDSIVLKVRKVDKQHKQILVVPVHADCNPHKLSKKMLKYHENAVLKPRVHPQDNLRYKTPNPKVTYEIVWEYPINDELMFVQADFSDGISVCPIVKIDASKKEVEKAIKEAYIKEKQRIIKEHRDHQKGMRKLKRLKISWVGMKGSFSTSDLLHD